jgi:hypothetical protein
VHWRDGRPADSPLLSFAGILWSGFSNVAQMLRARPPAPRPAVAMPGNPPPQVTP